MEDRVIRPPGKNRTEASDEERLSLGGIIFLFVSCDVAIFLFTLKNYLLQRHRLQIQSAVIFIHNNEINVFSNCCC